MPTSPTVSIVVPVYNADPYLAECVSSLENQSIEEVEIILVDDCSTDGSREGAAAMAERSPRIVFVGHEENRGAGGARNSGIEASTGQYVTIVDADDWLREDALELGVRALEKNDADIAVLSAVYFFEDDGTFEPSEYSSAKDLPASFRVDPDSILSIYGAVWGKLYRGDLLRDCGVRFTERVLFEDEDWTFRLLAHTEPLVVAVDEQVYYYRQHSASMMGVGRHSKTRTGFEDRLADVWEFLKQDGRAEPYGPPLVRMVSDALGYIFPNLAVEAQRRAYPTLRRLVEDIAKTHPELIDDRIVATAVDRNFTDYLAERNRQLSELERDRWYRFGKRPTREKLATVARSGVDGILRWVRRSS